LHWTRLQTSAGGLENNRTVAYEHGFDIVRVLHMAGVQYANSRPFGRQHKR
jgi:hypothetical protein